MDNGRLRTNVFLSFLLLFLQINFLQGKARYRPNFFDNCKKDEAIVQCKDDPCLTSDCPAYPEAKCRTNLCGKCKAEFLQEGKIVDCSRVPIWHDDCPRDVAIVQCKSDPCIGVYCKYYPDAQCRSNLCGACQAEFVLDGAVIKCEPPAEKKCPADRPRISCLFNPCSTASCLLFPGAICVPDYCGGCNAQFYQAGVKVNCALAAGELEIPCGDSRFGCCSDGRSTALGSNKEGCPGIYSECSKARRETIVSHYRRRYVPTCNLDGSYTAVQCWEAVKVCWCVDLEGNEKEGTRSINRKPICNRKDKVLEGPTTLDCRVSPFGCCPDKKTSAIGPYNEGCPGLENACWNSQFGCCSDGKSFAAGPNFQNCPRMPTECENHRDRVVKSSSGPVIGLYVPQCKFDGSYEPMQCFGSTGYCWCVNKDGKEFKGTRTKGKPDCSVIVPTCVDRRKDCKKHLHYCKPFLSYMKKYCAKSCKFCSGDEMVMITKKPLTTTKEATTIKTAGEKRFTQNPPVAIIEKKTRRPNFFDKCEMHVPIVQCKGDPCLTAGCLAYPEAICRTNLCGVCKAEFLQKGKIVDCTTSTQRPTTKRPGCGSDFGCCTDGLIAAVGPNYLGCPVYKSICDMPVATGEGSNSFTRYFYNYQQGKCEVFVYSGRGGNNNKFKSWKECEQTCRKDPIGPEPIKKSTTSAPKTTTARETTEPTTMATTTTSTEAVTEAISTTRRTTAEPTTTQRPTTTPSTRRPTTTRPTTIPTTVPPVPECKLRRDYVLAASEGDMTYALTRKDVQLPRCDLDGEFYKIQCWATTGQCWCVDQDGNEIEGTKTYATKPKCPKPKESSCRDVRRSERCKQFSARGDYCKKWKNYMKKYCAKTCNLCDYEPKRPGCSSKYGCCPDGVTPATARDFIGCPAHDSICDMQPVAGPCLAYLDKYFYNSTSGRCEKFIYGGCKGNKNNFDTELGCNMRCGKEIATPEPPTPRAVTTEAVTEGVTTTEATTLKVTTAEAITTELPTTKAATTEASTTDATTVEVTEPPTTQAATTEAVTERVTTTEAATVKVTTAEAITTELPTTKAATTEASTTDATTVEVTEPPTTQAATTEAVTERVTTTEAATVKVTTAEAITTELPTTKAATTEASTTDATTVEVTEPPTTQAATTEAVTERVTTTEAATVKVTTAEAITTELPTTKAATTEASTTDATTVEVTEPPTTQAATTEAVTERVTTTEAATVKVTTAEAITTELPTTKAATTEASTTDATTVEVTEPPTTQAATTEAVTERVTTTEAATVKVTTAEAITTELPTTKAATTEASTTDATTVEVTEPPTTQAATTEAVATREPAATTLPPPEIITDDQFGPFRPKVTVTRTATVPPKGNGFETTLAIEETAIPTYPTTGFVAREGTVSAATSPNATKAEVATTATTKATEATIRKPTEKEVITIKTATKESVIAPVIEITNTQNASSVATQSSAKDEGSTTLPPPIVVTEDQFRVNETITGTSKTEHTKITLPPDEFVVVATNLPSITKDDDLTTLAVEYTKAMTTKAPVTMETATNTQSLTSQAIKSTTKEQEATKPAVPEISTAKLIRETAEPEESTVAVSARTVVVTAPATESPIETDVPITQVTRTVPGEEEIETTKSTVTAKKEEEIVTPSADPSTKCLRFRTTFLKQLSGPDPTVVSRRLFVPKCDKDGNFERIQCWNMIGLCWCVGPHDGKELPGSRVNVSLGEKPDCFQSQLTVCERSRIEALKLSETSKKSGNPIFGLFVPKCNSDGLFEEVQCLPGTQTCWCVDKKTGKKVEGKGEPGNPTCIKKEESKCEKVRKLAQKLAEADFGDDDLNLGAFIPRCKEDGSYAQVQCLESSGHCWCVNENGEEVHGTKIRGTPNCNKVDKPLTDCQKKRKESLVNALVVDGKIIPPPVVFVPICEADGRFSLIQCHQSTGECWCVDEKGVERTRTRTREFRPNCERPLSRCERKRQHILTGLKLANKDHQSDTYLPTCDEDGNFIQIQCWDKIDECWCVNKEGLEIEHTRVVSGEPDCQKRNLTSCQKELERSSKEPRGTFVVECTEIGAYKKIQCYEGFCWCVGEDGVEIQGTRTEFGDPVCEKANLTKCQQKEKEIRKLTNFDGTPIIGAYIPQCKVDGSYSETQCHGSTGYCWCVDKEGQEMPGTKYRFDTPHCLRLLASKLSECEYKRRFLFNKHNGKVPDWLYVPQCEVNGSFSRQQCNEETGHCWCVNKEGKMTRWVEKSQTASVCDKGPQSECERKQELVFNKAFLINKRFPILPRGIFMPQCNSDSTFKDTQCHESYCWCVDNQGKEVQDTRKRFTKPDCKRILSGNLTECEVSRKRSLAKDNAEGSSYLPQCYNNGQYKRMQCNEATKHCWCVDGDGQITEWAKNISGKYQCSDLNESITICEQRRRDMFKLARIMNEEFPILPFGSHLPECKEDGSFKSIQCNKGFCWCVTATGEEITHTLTRFASPQCDRISSGNLTICERLREKTMRENSNAKFTRRYIFKCNQEGAFTKGQCNADIGACWCVNEEGVTIDGTVTNGAIPDCSPKNKTLCQNMRQEAYNKGITGADGITEPLPGAFAPHCKRDGSFESIQCHGSVSECWCVDASGAEVPETRVRHENPDCEKKKLSICEQKKQDVYKNATLISGRPVLPPGTYVPQCKENGDFEETQCHSSTGYCWCVDPHGHEIPKTSMRLQKPQCKRILAGNVTKCELSNLAQLGEDPLNPPQDIFLFNCDLDGQFMSKQCDGFLNICWCVNSEGSTIDGTETKEGEPDCAPRNNTACQQQRQDELNKLDVIGGRSRVAPGAYMPNCKENGDFEEIQCHGSVGLCWCVDENGNRIRNVSWRGRDIQCDRIKAGNLTKCERYREDTVGKDELPEVAFLPECEVDGSFKNVQCNEFLNECWCVDKQGRYIDGSNTKGGVPDCSERNVTICQLQRQSIMNTWSAFDGKPREPPSDFVPECKTDGSFKEVQCHHSTAYCWCVDNQGKEVQDTRKRFTKPDCKRILSGNLTECEVSRKRSLAKDNAEGSSYLPQCYNNGQYKRMQCNEATKHCWCVDGDGQITEWAKNISGKYQCSDLNESITICEQRRRDMFKLARIMNEEFPILPFGSHLPECKEDGSFKSIQCNKGFCWCVTATGEEITHTLTRFASPQCDRISSGNLTICEQLREKTMRENSNAKFTRRYIFKCNQEGAFTKGQCNADIGACWCVNEEGVTIDGTVTNGAIPDCSPKNKTLCQNMRQEAYNKGITGADGITEPLPGAFAPHCKRDGSFESIQCHGSVSECWCVDASGAEVPETRVRHENPDCEKKKLSICEQKKQDVYKNATLISGRPVLPPGTYVPQCKENGDFEETQCHSSTGYCWCVDPHGHEIPKTSMRLQKPQCKRILAGNVTKCELSNLAQLGEDPLNPPQDIFLFNCDLDGQFMSKQCDGFLNICWCVNSEGSTIDGTETKEGEPDCAPRNNTACQQQRQDELNKLDVIGGRSRVAPGAYMPNCKENGDFEEIQCHGSVGLCWCVDENGNRIRNVSWRGRDIQCDRIKAGNLTKCERYREDTVGKDELPEVAFLPECEVDGSFKNVQCNEFLSQCWCVDKQGRYIDGSNTKGGVPDCSERNVTICQLQRQSIMNTWSAFDGKPRKPPSDFVPECKTDGSFKEVQCHHSTAYCWCVDNQGKEVQDTRKRFTKPDCKRILSGNLTECEVSRKRSLAKDNAEGSSYLPQCYNNGQYKRMQCNEATKHCWCVDGDGQITEWAKNISGKYQCSDLNESITICEQRRRDMFKLARIMNEEFPILPFGSHLPECKEDGSFKSIQCNKGFCWCVTATGEEITHTLTRFASPQCDRISSGNLTICERLREKTMRENSNAKFTRRYIFKCNQEGAFTKGQCNADIGACWCVNEEGVTIDGTVTNGAIPDCSPKNKTLCQNMRQEAYNKGITGADGITEPLPGAFAPHCKRDGSFESIQCHGSVSECWCVDASGAEVPETRVRHENPDCEKKKLSICEQKKQDVYKNATLISGRPVLPPGTYVPQCKENGDFEETQCHSSTGYCWCVDPHGHEIPKTSMRLQKPQCKRILAGNVTKCELSNLAQLGEDPLNPPQDIFLFNCDLDGQFMSKQCDGFLNICWCVNSEGSTIDGTETKEGEPDCAPRNNTACQQQRQDELNKLDVIGGRSRVAPGAYMPNCKENGDFEEIQCHGSVGLCWCVDENGNRIRNVSWRGRDIQCDRIKAGNLTKCERYREDTVGKDELPEVAFLPECEVDGSFKNVQCNEFLNQCWCVDKQGRYIDGSNTKGGVPDCSERNVTICQLQRQSIMNTWSAFDGKPREPPSDFVPECKTDGSFKEVQCHHSTAYCWCVDNQGKEVQDTRKRFTKPDCKRILSGNLTECEVSRKRSLAKDNAEGSSYLPQCYNNGQYKRMQCNEATKHCWCVDGDGQITEWAKNISGKYQCSDLNESITICEQRRRDMFKLARIMNEEFPILPFGSHLPECKEDGSFKSIQCNKGFCWCVTATGEEITHTLTRFASPQCDRISSGNLTICEQLREKTMRENSNAKFTRRYIFKCNQEGAFTKGQCNADIGACWCVNEEGVTIDGTVTNGAIPDCSPKNKTLCQNMRQEAYNKGITGVDGITEPLPGAFAPHCKRDGSFESIQCHGSVSECWCVDASGAEVPETRVRHENPDCEKKKLSICEQKKQDVYKNATLISGRPVLPPGTYVPQCKENGDFEETQCHSSTGYCWCVDPHGHEIPKTSMRLQKPQCKRILAGNVTKCELSNLAQLGEDPLNPPQDIFLFNCDLDGQFMSKQCDGFLNICWCVNSEGSTIDGTETKEGEPDCAPRNNTACQQQRQDELNKLDVIGGTSRVAPGAYMPNCKESGDFEEIQCHGSVGFCWCVDENGNKIHDVSWRGRDVQCDRIKAGNLTKCERYREDTFGKDEVPEDAFLPECEVDGSFKNVQCNGFLNECWCVDKQGRYIDGSDTNGGVPDCSERNVTICQLQRQSIMNTWSVFDGKPREPPGAFVPECKTDGSFKDVQCHHSTAYCWCVDEEGNKRDETVTRFEEPDCTKQKQVKKTKCRLKRQEVFDSFPIMDGKKRPLLGAFVPECEEDGSFKETQCHEMNCWCVDKEGNMINGTMVQFRRPTCDQEKLSKCQMQLKDAYKEATIIDGKRVLPPGMFAPTCKEDGSFANTQCHISVGACFCVNEHGIEIPHTRAQFKKPECDRVLAGNLTKCERERLQPLNSNFAPNCEVNGSYSEIQCDSSSNRCWCVEENGKKRPETETVGGDPFCGAKVITECQKRLEEAYENSEMLDGERIFAPGTFVPSCKDDGNFALLQCHGSVGFCFCVNKDGKEIPDTRVRGQKPQCDRIVSGNFTKCELERRHNFVECEVDGSYKEIQCNPLVQIACWCVGSDGKKIPGTESFGEKIRKCSKTLTKCHFLAKEARRRGAEEDGDNVAPPGAFVPKCKDDGSFENLQCHASTGYCWCVDEGGVEITNTKSREGKPECDRIVSNNLTNCEQHRQEATEKLTEGIASFVPRCRLDGSFANMQCWNSECWCVDVNGNVINGTKSQAKPKCISDRSTTLAKTEQVVTTVPVGPTATAVTKEPTTAPKTTEATTAATVATTAEVTATTTPEVTPATTADVTAPTTAKVIPITTAEITPATTAEVTAATTAKVIPITTAEITAAATADVTAPTTAEVIPITTVEVTAATTPQVTPATTVEVTAAATAEVTTATTPEVTPATTVEVTAATTAEVTAATAPEVTPATTVEVTAAATPEVTPATTVEVTAATTAEVTPATTPEVTPATTVEVTAATVPEVTPATTVEVAAATVPEVTPATTAEVTPATTPEVTPATTAEVTAATVPEVTPATTAEVTPATTPEVTPATTVEVTAATTAEVTLATTAKVIPITTAEVTAAATPEVTPATTVEVTAEVTAAATPEVTPATTVEVTAEVTAATTPEVTPATTVEVTAAATPEVTPATTFEVTAATTAEVTAATTAEATTAPVTAEPKAVASTLEATTNARTTAKASTSSATTAKITTAATTAKTTIATTTAEATTAATTPDATITTGDKVKTTGRPFVITTSQIASEKPTSEEITTAMLGKANTTITPKNHPSACFLPRDPGPCKSRQLRYYYNDDPSIKDCLAFMYGGCRGNANNFKSPEECASQCRDRVALRTTAPVAKKEVDKVAKKIPGCNSKYGCCDDFVTAAKGLNQAGCPVYRHQCEYPKAKGSCKAKITRWYYNARLKICNSFIWGGCFGNNNNFASYESCMKRCQTYVPARVTGLSGEADGVELQSKFIPGCVGEYGCCADGVSPAKGPDQEGCPVYESICNMPAVKGYCQEGSFIRWHYNTVSGRCDSFRYSGCGGNENNFETPNQCAAKCEIGGPRCVDKIGILCIEWKRQGFCTSKWKEMSKYCQSTCGFCNRKR